jgi:hypothetical protein
MKERTIVSAFAMIGSVTAYYYAKTHAKDSAPMVMVGGFVGAMVGEVILQTGIIPAKKEDKSIEEKSNKK